jgi:hypothetical protein
LYKTITLVYLVCFSIYLVYSRDPDFIDSETYPARIQYVQGQPQAVFTYGGARYQVPATTGPGRLTAGEAVTVIFSPAEPAKGKLYSFFGYWFRWQEVLGSLVAYILLFLVARSITQNPTPEAVIEQLETPAKQPRKPRYDGNTW